MNGLVLRPGSTAWLLAHEFRLSLRAMAGRKGARRAWVILGGVAVLATLFGGVPMALALRQVVVQPTPLLVMIIDLAMVAIFTLMLSQTLAAATLAFYDRGDLDLLLSSPIPPSRVLTARAVVIALTPVLWFLAMATIAVVPTAILGHPQWTAVYAILTAIGLLAGAAGISLAMALFSLIGPRRTRTVGQLLAAFTGAAFFLVAQARNILPDHGRALYGGVWDWSRQGQFTPDGPLAWPARAVLGEPLPLLAFAGGSLILFTLVARGLGRRFAANASVAAGVTFGQTRNPARAEPAGGFAGGVFGNVLRKELRLLVRDPTLLSQVVLRALYLLPLAFIMLNTAHDTGAASTSWVSGVRLAVLAGGVALMAGQVAGSLSWITISAEDAPELIACAPVDGGLVRRGKLAASMIPVAVLLAAPLGALIWLSPWVGICATAGATATSASAGLVNLWFEKPAPRTAFRTRRSGSVTAAIAETLVGMGWGLTTGVAAAGSVFAILPAVFTLGGLALLYSLSAPQRAEAALRG